MLLRAYFRELVCPQNMSVRQFIQNAKTRVSELINGKTLEATIVDVLRKEGYQDVRTNVTLQNDKGRSLTLQS